MVTTPCFRDGRRAHRAPYTYPFLSEFRQTNTGSAPESPSGERSGDERGSSSSRKRIPVACGRCRKRKIRCSGDNGIGDPCINCRNAGASPCQFLRVSSEEASFKHDNGFSYNLADSRAHQARGMTSLPQVPTAPLPTAAYHEPISLGPIEAFRPYGAGPPCGYGHGESGERAAACASWNNAQTYCDASQQPSGATYQHPSLYPQSYAGSEARYGPQYQPSPMPTRSFAPFVDPQQAAYNYGTQGSAMTSTISLPHRPAPVIDAGGATWYHSIATGISNLGVGAGESSRMAAAATTAAEKAPEREVQQPYRRHESLSSSAGYDRSTASPSSPLPEMTPTSSYSSGSFDSPPSSSYPPLMPSTSHLRSLNRPEITYPSPVPTTPMPSDLASTVEDYSRSSSSSYVYVDTSAAAAAVANRRSTTSRSNSNSSGTGNGVDNCLRPSHVRSETLSGEDCKSSKPL